MLFTKIAYNEMLTIKIAEIEKHRNETTFRPWLQKWELFRDVGIKFIFEGNRYDMLWLGQASYMAKTKLEEESIAFGLSQIQRIVPENTDFVMFDGQDSASLMGTYEVYRRLKVKPRKFLKTALYTNPMDYTRPSPHGRTYWDKNTDINWFVRNSSDLNQAELTNTNWLSTVTPNWFRYQGAKKDIDVFAMFACESKENWEFGSRTDFYYDHHRKKCLNWLDMLPKNITVARLNNGIKVPIEEYYALMSQAKIVIAPFGYGEMAPRDIEAASVGAILIKPDMGHLRSNPFPYIPNETYVPVKWDYSDLNEKIMTLLENYAMQQEFYVENMRQAYANGYAAQNLVIDTYNWISNLEGYGTI
jgi:hypothetical protein